jgi:hypothetical protein
MPQMGFIAFRGSLPLPPPWNDLIISVDLPTCCLFLDDGELAESQTPTAEFLSPIE